MSKMHERKAMGMKTIECYGNTTCQVHLIKVPTLFNHHFLLLCLATIIHWSNFHIFFLASEKRFPCTKQCNIQISCAKVTKRQSFFGVDVL